jgi:hypothetical protein
MAGSLSRTREQRAQFVRRALLQQVRAITQALPHVESTTDIGVITRSLRDLARAIDGWPEEPENDWQYDRAHDGLIRREKLEESLGMADTASDGRLAQ